MDAGLHGLLGVIRWGAKQPRLVTGITFTALVYAGACLAAACLSTGEKERRARFILRQEVRRKLEAWEGTVLSQAGSSIVCDPSASPGLGAVEQSGSVRVCGRPSSMLCAAEDVVELLATYQLACNCMCSGAHDEVLLARLGYVIQYLVVQRLALALEVERYRAAARELLRGRGTDASPALTTRSSSAGRWWRAGATALEGWSGRCPAFMVPCGGGGLVALPISYFPCTEVLPALNAEWLTEVSALGKLLEASSPSSAALVELARYPAFHRRSWTLIKAAYRAYSPLVARAHARLEGEASRFVAEKIVEGIALVAPSPFGGAVPDAMAYTLGRNPQTHAGIRRAMHLLLLGELASYVTRMGIAMSASWILIPLFHPAAGTAGGDRDTVAHAVLKEQLVALELQMAERLLQAAISIVSRRIRAAAMVPLNDELLYQLSVAVEAIDEAAVREVKEKLQRTGTLHNLSDNVAEDVVRYYVRSVLRAVVGPVTVAFSALRGNMASLAFGALLCAVRRGWDSGAVGARLGWRASTPAHSAVWRLHRSLQQAPLPPEGAGDGYGTRILLQVLIEEHATGSARSASRAATATGRQPASPYLALVVMSAIWEFAGSSRKCGITPCTSAAAIAQLASLYTDCLRHHRRTSSHEGGWGLPVIRRAMMGGNLTGSAAVTACVDDLDAICHCVLPHLREGATSLRGSSAGLTTCSSQTQPETRSAVVDPEEQCMLRHNRTSEYITGFQFSSEMFEPSSFLTLRYLGVEVVFALRTAQRMCQSLKKWSLVEFATGVQATLFFSIQRALGEVTRAALFYLFLVQLGATATAASSYARQFTMADRYADLLSQFTGTTMAERQRTFRLACMYQLSHYAPTTVEDTSPLSGTTLVSERLMLWREHLSGVAAPANRRRIRRAQAGSSHRAPDPPAAPEPQCDLEFDEIGRICGGFTLRHGIRFQDVTLVYPTMVQLHSHHTPIQAAVYRVSCFIPANRMTAVIGPTGSGKSTLLALLGRLYDPLLFVESPMAPSGDIDADFLLKEVLLCGLPVPSAASTAANVIFLDGIPLKCFSVAYIRSLLEHVEQRPEFFPNLTFAQNIAFLRPIPADILHASATMARCDAIMAAKNATLTTTAEVLSSGEVLRIALARAFAGLFWRALRRVGGGVCGAGSPAPTHEASLAPAEGILLLDEPTSKLDGVVEAYIQDALARLLSRVGPTPQQTPWPLVAGHDTENQWNADRRRTPPEREPCGVTVVMIAHRLNTITHSHNIVVMHGGRAVDQGSVAELLRHQDEGGSAYLRGQIALQQLLYDRTSTATSASEASDGTLARSSPDLRSSPLLTSEGSQGDALLTSEAYSAAATVLREAQRESEQSGLPVDLPMLLKKLQAITEKSSAG